MGINKKIELVISSTFLVGLSDKNQVINIQEILKIEG